MFYQIMVHISYCSILLPFPESINITLGEDITLILLQDHKTHPNNPIWNKIVNLASPLGHQLLNNGLPSYIEARRTIWAQPQ